MDPRPVDPTEPELLDTARAGGAAVRGGALRVAGYGLGVVLSVASAALLFRHLGVVRTGQYVTVISLVGITQALTEVGISALGMRELSVRDAAGRAQLMRELLGLRLVLTTAGVLAAAAFALVAGYDRALVAGTLLAGAGLVIQNLQGTLAISLMTELRLGWVTLLELARQVIAVALVVALVAAGAALVPFLAIPVAAAVVTLASTALLVRGDVPLRPTLRVGEWIGLVRDALPFVVATAVYSLYFRIAVILVSLIVSEEIVGYFGAAFRIVEVLILVPGLAVSAVFPIFARAARDDLDRLAYAVERTFQTVTVFGVWVGLCVAIVAPFAIEVVAGADFDPAVPMLRIQAIALGAAWISQAFGYALLGLRRHRTMMLASTANLVLASVLCGVLAELEGGEGAAVAVAIGEVSVAVSYGIAYVRAMPGHRLALGVLPRVAAASVGAALVAVLIAAHPLVVATVASVVYFGVLLALRAIPLELLDELRRPLARRHA
jgi:O-antigen/teichoic acid export membrane protein